ncbi:hypothetical protein, partial [uncultured Campylobacter sp.]|uniref:hypothetical protein n=1 Tax=uncultured Campylobacter sp. TaxID=218934 RepID=UPI00262F44A8
FTWGFFKGASASASVRLGTRAMTLLAYKAPSRDGRRVTELARRAFTALDVSGRHFVAELGLIAFLRRHAT